MDGLGHWMRIVDREVRRARRGSSERVIHDLRVALRRCRTLAGGLRFVRPRGPYAKISREAKKLFRALSALREIQVRRVWVLRLCGPRTVFRTRLLALIKSDKAQAAREVREALAGFNLKAWSKLRKAQKEHKDGAGRVADWARVTRCAMIAKIKRLHRRALKSRRPADYHKLRIAYKKYRYFTGCFTPELARRVDAPINRVQSLLGDAHDLDELRVFLTRNRRKLSPDKAAARLIRAAASAERERLGRYRVWSAKGLARVIEPPG